MSDPDFEHLFTDCPGLFGGCPQCVAIFDALANRPPAPKPLNDPDKTFTCPDCEMVSSNFNDVVNSYCGRCHAFKWEDYLPPRCMEPTCPDFGSYDFGSHDFGEATCLAEHAWPPAKRGNRHVREILW